MHEQQQHDPRRATRTPGQGFGAPRLELPRFQFASGASLARAEQPAPQPAAAPAVPVQQGHAQHAPVHPPQPQYAPAPQQYAPARQQYAPAQQAPTYQATPTAIPQPVAVSYAPSPVAPGRPAVPPRPAPRPALAATATRPAAAITWERLDPASSEPTLLQRITPVHMGVLLVMVMVMMVVNSGPATMSIKPARLPALAAGGGTSGDPLLPPRAGSTAVNAARASGAPAAHAGHAGHAGHDGASGGQTPVATKQTGSTPDASATRARVQLRSRAWIIVGNARVKRTVRSGGIPSPAAAANLAVAGGGRVAANSTASVNLRGIPSAAAAANLGPQTLPYRPNDGVTLPRMAAERDSHAVDSHYGRDTLPMEAPVATPALTPGAAAEQAQQRAILHDLAGSQSAPVANGGLVVAY